jgi:phasin protein
MPSNTTPPFDPSAWVEAQRRNLEAFTSAGQIVADGMRAVAERQAAMVQDAMHELWGEMQSVGRGGAKPAGPADQLDRMRHAFERVLGQVQEISNMLLKAQAEAMDILNRCATANMEAFGGVAPDLAKLQQGAVGAMQAATSQVTAAIEEMRRRMSQLEGETRQATGGSGGGGGEGAAAPGRGGAGRGKGKA